MADSSEPAFLFLYRKGAVAQVDYLSTFATAPFFAIHYLKYVWIANFGTEYNREPLPWAVGK